MTQGRHHVIPVTLGGTKQVPLCAIHHALVHETIALSPLILNGLRKARERGVKLGAPLKATSEVAARVSRLRSEGNSIKVIAAEIGVSVGTVCNVIARERRSINP